MKLLHSVINVSAWIVEFTAAVLGWIGPVLPLLPLASMIGGLLALGAAMLRLRAARLGRMDGQSHGWSLRLSITLERVRVGRSSHSLD